MDDTLMRVVLLLIDIIGPISIGYFLKQKNLVKPAFNDFMIKLNVRGLFTVLAFVAFWKLKFTAEVALIPIAGLIILFVPYFLGMAITKKVEDAAGTRRPRGVLHAWQHEYAWRSSLLHAAWRHVVRLRPGDRRAAEYRADSLLLPGLPEVP